MEEYILKDGKKLRLGYTTGSCAAAAAKAAAFMLLTGEKKETVKIQTPKGLWLTLPVEEIFWGKDMVSCGIRKDGGDDPDVTTDLLICAAVRLSPASGAAANGGTGAVISVGGRTEAVISVDGGTGVGRVTRRGLDQPVGAAAINSVPRKMIRENVEEVCRVLDYCGGLSVEIFVPGGEEAAKRTFNEKLGILGGISILGTTGIVEPMSERALLETMELEMKQKLLEGGGYLLVTPGNYGEAYIKNHMDLPMKAHMKCGNYVGDMIDMAAGLGARGILFVAHGGKFVKVAAGIMNTHSKNADGRAEILAANAIRAGISMEGARAILDTGSTDEAFSVIAGEGLLGPVTGELMSRIEEHLERRAGEKLLVGAVMFSHEFGFLGQTKTAGELMRRLRNQAREPE